MRRVSPNFDNILANKNTHPKSSLTFNKKQNTKLEVAVKINLVILLG